MEKPYIFKVHHPSVLPLLAELETLGFIKVLEPSKEKPAGKLSDKYRGILTAEEGRSLDAHVKEMREEWDDRL